MSSARLPGTAIVTDAAHVRHLFVAEHVAFVLDAIVAGTTSARVWADDRLAPSTAMVWDGTHCLYLAGAFDRPQVWRELFEREIASTRPGLLKAYVTEAVARTIFSADQPERHERVLYQATGPATPGWAERVPAGFRISAIDDQFATLGALTNFDAVVAEIESCWRSVEDFRRSGFGFAAHDAETIASWCTAEYVSEKRCGTGVETVAAYRGRGLATLTASAFLDHCFVRGTTAYWDAWTSNLPSIAVAEKVGFRRVDTYEIFVDPTPGQAA